MSKEINLLDYIGFVEGKDPTKIEDMDSRTIKAATMAVWGLFYKAKRINRKKRVKK